MQNLVQKGVEIFSSSRKQPIFLPKLKTVCKITKSAEITLQDTLITELSAKRRRNIQLISQTAHISTQTIKQFAKTHCVQNLI